MTLQAHGSPREFFADEPNSLAPLVSQLAQIGVFDARWSERIERAGAYRGDNAPGVFLILSGKCPAESSIIDTPD